MALSGSCEHTTAFRHHFHLLETSFDSSPKRALETKVLGKRDVVHHSSLSLRAHPLGGSLAELDPWEGGIASSRIFRLWFPRVWLVERVCWVELMCTVLDLCLFRSWCTAPCVP